MPIIFDHDMKNYVDVADQRVIKKYNGGAIYLPRGMGIRQEEYEGEGFSDLVSSVGSFLKDNKDAISAGTSALSNIASTAVGIAKGVEEVKNIQALRQQNIKRKEIKESDLDSSVDMTDQELIDRIRARGKKTEGKGFKIL